MRTSSHVAIFKQGDAVLEVRVVTILDGDTVDVLPISNLGTVLPYRIRLAQIAAPEKDQPFGTDSTSLLSQLINAKSSPLSCITVNANGTTGSSGVSKWQGGYVMDEMLSNIATWFNS